MEGAKQAPRLTDERIVASSDELRMQVNLKLLNSFLCRLSGNVLFREMAIKHLGLDLNMTYDGITPLKFISKDSLLNLKDACDTTKVEDFLQCLFVESEVVNVLGRVKFKMFICKMSLKEYGCYIQTKGKLTEGREDEELKILNLFVEELDPDQLFEDLFNRHLVGENDRQQVMNCIPRKQRMEFLIGRLNVLKRNKMLNILLVHCMMHDYQYLKKKINDIYGGNTGNSHFTGKRVEDESLPGQKLFTADFTLSIQESTGALKVDIQHRKWYLDTVEANKEEVVIMGLIPDCERTEEKAVTTAAPIFTIPESHDANEESHQNMSTLDSDRLESSGVDQSDSKQGSNSCNSSNISPGDLAHVAGIDTDASPNDQDSIIYQRQQPAGNRSDFSVSSEKFCASEAEGSIRTSQSTRRVDARKLHSKVLNQCLKELVRCLDVKAVCISIQQREVLDDVTVRDILEQTTTSEKIMELIKHIRQRDQHTYEKFKECLILAKQEFLKNKLEEEEAKFAE